MANRWRKKKSDRVYNLHLLYSNVMKYILYRASSWIQSKFVRGCLVLFVLLSFWRCKGVIGSVPLWRCCEHVPDKHLLPSFPIEKDSRIAFTARNIIGEWMEWESEESQDSLTHSQIMWPAVKEHFSQQIHRGPKAMIPFSARGSETGRGQGILAVKISPAFCTVWDILHYR